MLVFYDFEVFKCDWLVVLIDPVNRTEDVIVNDKEKLEAFYSEHKNDIWIGYNSRHYDQYILKGILCGFNPKDINDYIIVQGKKGWQYSSLFRSIPLNNFDVFHPAIDRGLKTHEGFMGSMIKESSIDFNIDRKLTADEINETIKYCRHDVEQTIEVFLCRKNEFDARLGLLKLFGLNISCIDKTDAQLTAMVLNAKRRSYDDEFDISFPPTLKLNKYKYVLDWYKDKSNLDYKKSLKTTIAGVPHIFAWGGIHGAIPQYYSEGYFINMDVTSYYPSLMIEYDLLSRSVLDKNKFKEIYDMRVAFKKAKDPRQIPLKTPLNGTYGACKDKNNALYDPRQANNVCVYGQLLLLDLIEHLEPHCRIIQSNTDGVLVQLHKEDDFELIDDIAWEWEQRTGMRLEFDTYKKIYQKDVNNYLVVDSAGHVKSKGSYVKKQSPLDYDLPIVNKAIVNYMTDSTSIEATINTCDDLIMFQKIVKISGKYLCGWHNNERLTDKTFRVFASNRQSDGFIGKQKSEGATIEKFGNTPDKCFIDNLDVTGRHVPDYLDRQWYIDLAKKRLLDFGVEV